MRETSIHVWGDQTVAKVEGENDDFQQLELPGEDLGEAEMSFESVTDAEEAASAADELLAGEFPDVEKDAAEAEEQEPDEEAEEKVGFLSKLAGASPYTVMLGLALAAILTACTCLLLEWSSYKFDMDASDYTQRAE
jgi:hypothetical protein